MDKKLILNIDYYLSVNGDLVFTKKYHLERGHCCKSGCINCPYGDIDPHTPQELNSSWSEDHNLEENEDD